MKIDALTSVGAALLPEGLSAPKRAEEFSEALDKHLTNGAPPDIQNQTNQATGAGEAENNPQKSESQTKLDSNPTEPTDKKLDGDTDSPEPADPATPVDVNPAINWAAIAPAVLMNVQPTPVTAEPSADTQPEPDPVVAIATNAPKQAQLAAAVLTSAPKVDPNHPEYSEIPESPEAAPPANTDEPKVEVKAPKVAENTEIAPKEVLESLNPTKIEVETPKVPTEPTVQTKPTVTAATPEVAVQQEAQPVIANNQSKAPTSQAAVNSATEAVATATKPVAQDAGTELDHGSDDQPAAKDPSNGAPAAGAQRNGKLTKFSPWALPHEETQSHGDALISNMHSDKSDASLLDDGSAIEVNPLSIKGTNLDMTKIEATTKPEATKTNDEINQKVLTQVMDKLDALMASRKNGSVVVHLEPRELGSITITVRMRGEKCDIQMHATDPVVREALAADKGQLIQQVQAKGMTLNSFNVGEHSLGSWNHSHSNQDPSRQNRSSGQGGNVVQHRQASSGAAVSWTSKGMDLIA